MGKHLFRKPETQDLSNPITHRPFIEEAHSGVELMRKELEINQMEQSLLNQRIQMMKSFINDLPSSDPQYNMLLAQIEMDRIEMDELILRETEIVQRLDTK